jgi:hypothetical protein
MRIERGSHSFVVHGVRVEEDFCTLCRGISEDPENAYSKDYQHCHLTELWSLIHPTGVTPIRNSSD